jgi:hypothetical protein
VTLPLDYQIDAAHHEAQRIENEALAIEARIIKAGATPPLRQYGKPVSREAVSRNLTTTGLLQRRDPALASFLGVGSDYHQNEAAAAAARQASAQALQAKTEQLRKQNEAAAEARFRRQLSPRLTRFCSFVMQRLIRRLAGCQRRLPPGSGSRSCPGYCSAQMYATRP